jgi:hypothetical protein
MKRARPPPLQPATPLTHPLNPLRCAAYRTANQGRRQLAQVMDLLERLGTRPPAGEHERISFWAVRRHPAPCPPLPPEPQCRHGCVLASPARAPPRTLQPGSRTALPGYQDGDNGPRPVRLC